MLLRTCVGSAAAAPAAACVRSWAAGLARMRPGFQTPARRSRSRQPAALHQQHQTPETPPGRRLHGHAVMGGRTQHECCVMPVHVLQSVLRHGAPDRCTCTTDARARHPAAHPPGNVSAAVALPAGGAGGGLAGGGGEGLRLGGGGAGGEGGGDGARDACCAAVALLSPAGGTADALTAGLAATKAAAAADALATEPLVAAGAGGGGWGGATGREALPTGLMAVTLVMAGAAGAVLLANTVLMRCTDVKAGGGGGRGGGAGRTTVGLTRVTRVITGATAAAAAAAAPGVVALPAAGSGGDMGGGELQQQQHDTQQGAAASSAFSSRPHERMQAVREPVSRHVLAPG